MHARLRTPRAALALLLASLAACAERAPSLTEPTEPLAAVPEVDLAIATCTADALAATLRCEAQERRGGEIGTLDVNLGTPFVRLTSANVQNTGTHVSYDVAVQNMLAQWLGTPDGVAPTGLRVFFHSGPSHGVTVENADGKAKFTASNQPFFQYPEMLDVLESSGARPWVFRLNGASSFTFTVAVRTKLPDEKNIVLYGGPVVETVSVAPATAEVLLGGEPLQLSATLRNAAAEVVTGPPVRWSSSDDAVATVDAAGMVTPVAEGQATITARSQSRSGSAHVTVTALVAQTLSAGEYHSCALTPAGHAYCWGNPAQGQLGIGNTNVFGWEPLAVQMPQGVTFRSISAGGWFTVALDTEGRAWAWGENDQGQLGDNSTSRRLTPRAVQMPTGVSFGSISAGLEHTVALSTDGVAYAWGRNNRRQLGDNSSVTRRTTPVLVSTNLRFRSISAGGEHTVALSTDGVAYAWGRNDRRQLGDNSAVTQRPTPTQVVTNERFRSISAGFDYTVALTDDGVAFGWGDNSVGSVGDGAFSSFRAVPTRAKMPANVRFRTIGTGRYHTLALTSDGVAYAWGWGFEGILGNGTVTDRSEPTQVTMPQGVAFGSIAGGYFHSVAISTSGRAFSWGRNTHDQLGAGPGGFFLNNRLVPDEVYGGITFR